MRAALGLTGWSVLSGLVLYGCVGGAGEQGDAGVSPCPCDSRAEMAALIDPTFVDCSDASVPGAVQMCVSNAVAARSSFLIEGDLHGTESQFVQYLVGNGKGDAFQGTFDGDPSRGSGACATLDIQRCSTFQIFDQAPFPGASTFNCLNAFESRRLCGPDLR